MNQIINTDSEFHQYPGQTEPQAEPHAKKEGTWISRIARLEKAVEIMYRWWHNCALSLCNAWLLLPILEFICLSFMVKEHNYGQQNHMG